MYTYPARPTGTAEDLMGVVTRAAERAVAREGTVLPAKSRLARACWEPAFNIAGICFHCVLGMLPADFALALHDAAIRRLAADRAVPFDPGAPALGRAAAEAGALASAAGRPPAIVALLSHPPVLGEMSYLNYELVRHACRAIRVIRGAPCRPRLVAAVDAYALDTLALPAEGFYAGFMSRYHLGFDRLALARGAASARLLAAAAWPRFGARLLRLLNGGGDAVMALSGGVPATVRALYAAREWSARWRAASPGRAEPARVRDRMRAQARVRDFILRGPFGPGLRRSAWRLLEGWSMSAVAGHPWDERAAGVSCAQTGALDAATQDDLRLGLEALGLAEGARAEALAELALELRRQTPWRARFFRLLDRRVLRRGRPILFVPVVHRADGRPRVEVREAWAWCGPGPGRSIRARSAGRLYELTADEFALRFGGENFA